ncbi:MAG: DUF1552 domain-containing protein, partial [Deltaproteobacteria bacterium]|nr:DUF1552 domain-containing protein [Kofleriaceae bacterium]
MSQYSRRSLLQHLGLGAAAFALHRVAPRMREARAAESGPPKRLILWPSMNGAAPQHFWPSPGNLAALSLVLEPLRAWSSKMTFVRGLDIEGSYNHFAVRSMFTGAPVTDYLSPDPAVKSVDQVVADHVAATAPTAMRSLHLGAIPADSIHFYQLYGRSTFFFNPTPVHYEANPVTAFDAIFGGLGGGGGTPPPPRADYAADVHAITKAELDTLEQKVGGSPRELRKVRDHQTAVAALGGSGATPPAACDGTPI